MFTQFAALALASATLGSAQNVTQSILHTLLSRPGYAVPLSPTIAGLSIEGDRWPDWSGNLTSPNNFTWTLLNNIKERTGSAVSIRIGGTTEDTFYINPDVEVWSNVFPAVPAVNATPKKLFPEALYTSVGRDFYLLSGNLPSGTQFTWGVNLLSNTSEAVMQVKAIQDAFQDPHCASVSLQLVEIGNEPDEWAGSYKPANYTVFDYASTYEYFVSQINEQLQATDIKYQIGALAANWRAADLYSTGIESSSAMGSQVGALSEHHYMGSATSVPPPTADQVVDHTNILNNLTRYGPGASWTHQLGYSYYIGETGSLSDHGGAGISNAGAAALWIIDYTLQAGTLGVDGVRYHNGVGYNYSLWQPIDHLGQNITSYNATATRHILPQYNGLVALADAVGDSNNAFISEIGTDNVKLAAYAIWEGTTLARIALVNSVPWYQASNGTRPSLSITLPELYGRNITAKRLTLAGLDSLSGVTWGGQSWETYSGLAEGSPVFEAVPSNGTFSLPASSAALLYL